MMNPTPDLTTAAPADHATPLHPVSIAQPFGPRDVTGNRQVSWRHVGQAWGHADGADGLTVQFTEAPGEDLWPHLVITQAPDPLGVPGLRDLPAFHGRDARLGAYEVTAAEDLDGRRTRWRLIGYARLAEDERGYTLHLTRLPADLTVTLLPLGTGHRPVHLQV